MDACCNSCVRWVDLAHWIYNEDGTVDKVSKGEKVCLACSDEGIAIHMVGGDPDKDMCEMYFPRSES